MFKKPTLLLVASLFIFTNVTAGYAFHNGNSGAPTAQADSQSGSANFGVPIDVPPGRAGIQPNLQLQYSSSLPNGLLGVGWSLELGSIQRSTKKGVPSYTDSDTFVLVQSGSGQELVYDPTAGFYRAKVEGAFMRIQKSGNTWVVTDKKGIKYYFGTIQSAREYDFNDTARIFKWCLSSVEDLHGNTMTITYWRDGNRLYPQYIDYTSNPSNSLASFARVEFLWSSRPDQMDSYTAGFLMGTHYRLSRVNVSTGNDLQYRFDLTYHSSNATSRSILEKITQYGADGTSTLPPLTFLYQEYVNQPAPVYNAVTTSLTNSSTSNVQFFGDFNGDGRTDRGLYDQSVGNLQVALSNGAGFQSPSGWAGTFSPEKKFLSGNFDSGGVTDLCVFNPSSGNWDVLSPNGQNQFASKGTWISGFGASKEPATGDFNGDGLTDIAYFYNDTDGTFRAQIALNTGSGFTSAQGANPLISNSVATGITGDFNGDGLTDFGVWNGSTGFWEIRLNPGNVNGPFLAMVQLSNFGPGKQPVIADFDSDGLTDIGYYDSSIQKVVYRLSNGKTFASEQSLFLGWNIASVQAVDFNGDGLPDFVPAGETGSMKVNYSSGVFPDLLDTSDNGVGGTATIEYAPSTNFNNPKLPFPLQLVKSASQSNNLGDVYTTRYEYTGGLWDGADREFRGFGTVKVTDPDGNYMEMEFLQDEIFRGRPLEQRSYDSSGNLFAKARNLWKSQEIAPGVQFVYLSAKNNFVYDGNLSGKRTLEEYFYEETTQRGNLTRVEQYGEVDLVTGNKSGTDVRRIKTEYINDTTNWIIGLPSSTRVEDYYNNTLRKTMFYYDAKGFLTKKEDWAGTGNVNPVTQYSYDAIGNLSTTTDPKGNVTRVTYDTAYNMFPLTTENALAHKVTNEYYGVNGVALSGGGLSGLWGQVKSTTDPNQQQGKRSYDVFGRLTTTISPLDSVTYPTQTTAIQYFSDYTKVTSRQRIKSGQAQTIDTISFYDGLGRLIQTKTPSEVLGRYVVSGQAEYDSRGLKNKQSLPYFSTNPVDTIEPINSTGPRSTIEYDAMGRPVRTTNPDGTYASVAYDDWITSSTDENGHKQASYFDAWGRLIKKEEYTGADGRSPNYSASPYTLYATTLYSYDSEGNLVRTKDAYNNTTAITYDVLGRKTAMTDPDMGAWSYAYDLNGNLTRQIDAKGQTLTFTYDALNRLTNKTDGTNGTVNVNYTYDNASSTNSKGRLTQATYTGGNTQFAYDELGRELQSIKQMNTTNYSVNRGYDALNRLLNIQYPDQKNVYYQYNSAGQIESVANDQTLFPVVGLNPPELGAIQSGDAKVQLSWTTAPGATGYRVKYGTSSGSYTAVLDVGNVTGIIISGLTNDIPYYFAMVAYNADSESVVSNERMAIPTFPPVLSLSFDGKDAAVNTTDLTGRHAITFNGNAQLDTAQKKSGTASLLLDGTGDYLTTGDHDDWNFGTGDFTIDFWCRHTGLGGWWLEQFVNSSNFIRFGFTGGSQFVFQIKSGGSDLANITLGAEITLSTNTWHHMAIVRYGNTFTIYRDGTSIGSTTASITLPDFAAPLFIGYSQQSGTYWNGWIDEFRISKGVARWTSDFTPSYAFNRGENTGTSHIALRTSEVNEGRETLRLGSTRLTTSRSGQARDEGRTVFSTVASWFERNLLGVGEAEAAPAAPVLNTATAGNAQVSLGWGAVSGATGYKVKYGTTSGTYTTTIDVGNVTSYSAAGLTNGKTYYFVTMAYDSAGTSVNSNEKSAVPTTQPFATTLEAEAMPTKTTGGATTGGWNIWSNGYIEDTITFPRSGTYELEIVARGSIAAGVWPNMQLRLDQVSKADITVNTTTWKSFIKQVSVTSGSHKVAIAFTNDYYVAPDDRNLYVDKVIIREITSSPPPAPTLNSPAAGDAKVDLSWNAATGATGYKIYYGTAPGVYGTPITVGNTTTSTVTGLTNGTTYYFAVSATNTGGESTRSNEKSATPAAPMTENPTLFIKNVDYNASGQMTKVELGNGDVTTYTYNSLNLRLTRLYTVNALAQPVQDLNYTYDSAGNILSIDDKVNTADQTFKYDELNRLVEAVNPNPGSYGTKSYTYDKIGNIAAKDGKTYFYGGSNGGPHAVTALSDGTTFTYDADGNMVTKVEGGGGAVTTNYKYDAENRLIEVQKGATIIGQYTYDGDGGRTTKTATVSGTTTTTTFVGSLFETSGSRNTKFIFLGGQRVAAVTNSPTIGSTTLYYHADHLGGANVLTDATGFKKELIEYEPFGQESRHEKYGSSEEVAWYYFTGKKTDDESGLIYFGARYYDPKLGRFITPDILIPRPDNPQEFNRYSYALNNPVNRIDPSGHKSWWKKFWGGVKDFVRDYGGMFGLTGGVLNGVINGDWQPLKNMAIAGASAFVLSGFNPVVAIAAIATTGFLDSKPGRQVTSFVASEIMDDAFGMRPGSAQVWARLTLQIAGTLAVENMIKSAMADPVTSSKYDPKNPAHKAITDHPKGYDPSGGRYPGGANGRGFDDVNSMKALVVRGQSQPTAVLGSANFGPMNVLEHTGAISSSFPANDIQPLVFGHDFFTGYGTVFGVCHQATNATLLASGISSTVWDISPQWSTFASTVTYGNYGGQLSNYVYTGIRTDIGYDKNN